MGTRPLDAHGSVCFDPSLLAACELEMRNPPANGFAASRFPYYNERLDAEMENMVWRHPRVKSYYNNSEGRVITNVPWTMYDYWDMTRRVDLKDYAIE